MKISIQAKELSTTITDEDNNVVLSYSVENYKLDTDFKALTDACIELFMHAQLAAKAAKL